ncbi:CHAT domain-containing protein [Fortiea sp. LEGE XX443]|uniref:CHAT domain-containing protein n=1 Tax=Fortiea sp. LEGE XX443 TaxID=1828611 RepID=UPI001D14C75A|nr:CHAT domain-containing protein [Fortiea sp. LEGE XX443]
MLKRLWQWLKRLLRRLFTRQPVSPPERELRREELPQLTDAELSVGEVGDVAGNRGLLEGGETNRRDAEDAEEGEAEVWFNQGYEQLMAGDYAGAIASWDNALKIKPDDHLAWYNRGVALAKLGQYEQAISSYDNALNLKPNDHEAWDNRGVALAKLGQYEQAISSYDNALKIQPDFHEAWDNRGVALHNLEQYEQAISSYDNALKIQPDFHEAWDNRGVALHNLEQYEQAIASYDNALEFQPDFHEVWHNRGVALANLEQYEQAIASYDNALEFQPDFHEVWHNRGVALANLGQWEQAIASYDKALEFQPDDHLAWFNRGVALANLGQWEQAIASYDKALEFQPDDHLAWFNRGVALGNLGQYEQVIASYDKALQVKPDFHEVWHNRGIVLCDHLHRYKEAITSFQKALEFQPDFHETWYNRGVALGNLGQDEQAIASYDNALKFKRDFHLAWLNRGNAAGYLVSCNEFLAFSSPIARQNSHLNRRGYEGALASYQEGLKYCQEETHPEGWGLLHQAIGNAHYFRGRGDSYPRSYWRNAVRSYNEALKTLTAADFPELHLGVLQDLIRVHSDLGETNEAVELQRQGTDVLRRLLDEPNRPDKNKKQLTLKFAWLQQLTVDLAIQSGELVQAVELAEQGKNACLSWLLDGWSDEISSPSYSQMRQLLNPTTVIVYWHLSHYALHTFILKHDTPEPIVLGEWQLVEENGVIRQAQRLRDFEDWLKNWNEQYADYPKGKKGEAAATWRDNLPGMLDELANILNIPAILQDLTPQPPSLQGNGENKIKVPLFKGDLGGSDDLHIHGSLAEERFKIILIPHRDLHRLPLHALFPPEFTISYLPSVQIGLIPPTPLKKGGYELYQLLSIEHPENTYLSLEFAQIESQVISCMFTNPTRIRSQEVTKAAMMSALPQGYNIFHFTGHGAYNFHNPALSFLALAGKDKLTLADIRHFDLTSYQLVSLAACETAITGNHTITTEYVGLVSGFMSCGVAHVVSTLWTVESEPSAVMMMRFYQLLHQGNSEAMALAEATQWLRYVTNAELAEWYAAEIDKLPEGGLRRLWLARLNNLKNQPKPSNQPYNHPYFWAAFTITGNFLSCNQ